MELSSIAPERGQLIVQWIPVVAKDIFLKIICLDLGAMVQWELF